MTRRLWIADNTTRNQPNHSERFVHVIWENESMFRSLRQLTLLTKCFHRIWCRNEPDRDSIHLVSSVPAVLFPVRAPKASKPTGYREVSIFFLRKCRAMIRFWIAIQHIVILTLRTFEALHSFVTRNPK